MDEFFGTLFGSTAVSQQLAYLQAGVAGSAIWETIYSTVLATFFAYVIGLPLGVLLVTGEKDGIRPLPSAADEASSTCSSTCCAPFPS